MMPSSRTRVFALLGDPVYHSLSPRIHNAAFLVAGLDAVYVALAVGAGELGTLMGTLAANGGGGNITIPHKAVATVGSAARSARVSALGVANVFGSIDGTLSLENTDVDGVLAAFDRLGSPSGDWLILGTGGSARAVAAAALERHVRVGVSSRDSERAASFAAWAAALGLTVVPRAECTIAVNATPLGLQLNDAAPLDLDAHPSLRAVLDLTYRAAGHSELLERCRARGIAAIDGREVLLAQGAAAWRLWFPGVTPPLDVMRAALDGRLG